MSATLHCGLTPLPSLLFPLTFVLLFADHNGINMKTKFSQPIALGLIGVCIAVGTYGCASTSAPAQAVMLLEPANNATVATTFKVRFGIKGMDVAPAGEILPNSGHHHLLINQDAVAQGESVPFSDQHLHFGKGQTETEVKLPPGTYKLTAQFANGAHQSYGKPMSQSITITVK
jgi:hypothetical protein